VLGARQPTPDRLDRFALLLQPGAVLLGKLPGLRQLRLDRGQRRLRLLDAQPGQMVVQLQQHGPGGNFIRLMHQDLGHPAGLQRRQRRDAVLAIDVARADHTAPAEARRLAHALGCTRRVVREINRTGGAGDQQGHQREPEKLPGITR
jgi:hypothetical protein